MNAALHHPDSAWDRRFLAFLAFVLLGYALLGRGIAYLGVAPLFIGEMALGLGLLAAVLGGYLLRPLATPVGALFTAVAFIGTLRLLGDVPRHGVEAVRDAVIWGYGVFAIVIAALMLRDRAVLARSLHYYRRFVPVFLGLAWLLYVAARVLDGKIPSLPGSPATLLEAKGGDLMVHLAGVTCFVMVGLTDRRWWFMPAIALNFLAIAPTNRGGMLAFLAAVGLVVLFRNHRVHIGKSVYGGLIAIMLLIVVNPRVQFDERREVSLEQFVENVRSIGGGEAKGDLDGTRTWRLNWWTDIVGYTFGGPHFMAGKGFGPNLATEDGYQVNEDESLRSPHNAHMTILARMGVPAFILWMAMLAGWGVMMLRNVLLARRRGDDGWHGILLFLLAYWTAHVLNASFDVFLEGPMGGIWFWSVFGAGLGACLLYQSSVRTDEHATSQNLQVHGT